MNFLKLLFSLFCLLLLSPIYSQGGSNALAEDDVDPEYERLTKEKREIEADYFPVVRIYKQMLRDAHSYKRTAPVTDAIEYEEGKLAQMREDLERIEAYMSSTNLRGQCADYDAVRKALHEKYNPYNSAFRSQCEDFDGQLQAIRDKMQATRDYIERLKRSSEPSSENTLSLSFSSEGKGGRKEGTVNNDETGGSDAANQNEEESGGSTDSISNTGERKHSNSITSQNADQASKNDIAEQIARQNESLDRQNEALDAGLAQISQGNYQAAAYTFANAGMLEATIVASGAGAITGIIEAAREERMQNIRNKTKYLKSALERLPQQDERVRQLYLKEDYDAFFVAEEKLRLTENSALSNANWLIEKAKSSESNRIYREISERRVERIKLIMKYQTDTLIKSFATLRNAQLIAAYINYNSWDKNRIKNYFKRERDSRYRNQLMSELNREKLRRFNKILLHDFKEENYNNKESRLLDDYHLVQFYLSNPYRGDEFDKWFSNKFFELGSDQQKSILKEILDIRNLTVDLYGPVTAPKPSKNDAKLRLLLGNGDKLNYYMDVSSWFSKKKSPYPLYEYLDTQSIVATGIWSGYKNTTANALVKQWVKRDEERTGKSAKTLSQERSRCIMIDCRSGEEISKYEFIENKAINSALSPEGIIGSYRDAGDMFKESKPKKAYRFYKIALSNTERMLKEFPNSERLNRIKSNLETKIKN